MNEVFFKVATAVIEKSDANHPADAVLRDELRKQRGLTRDDGWEISKAIFAYFRWLGWMNAKEPLPSRMEKALRLTEKFREYPDSFFDDHMVAKAVPDWIREQVDVTPAFARALQKEPKLWLRTKHGMREAVERELRYCSVPENANLPDALEYEGSIDLFRTPQFHEGLFELQDIASQAVSVICDPKPGETWWDACAGEGGKTLHLSELMQNKGLIWASDRAEWRLKRLKQRAARAKAFNYRAVSWDGSEKLPTKTKFDGVLVDAPCSGVGTWQRNPHARWTTTAQDVSELAEVQSRLLGNVAGSVKPGGKLVYSVCTLTRAETTDVVTAFQKAFPDFEPVDFPNPLQPKTIKRDLFMWPQEFGGNGMFVASWKRK
ncbi:MAG: RsmB/NOP family class I SAM-dependent RNA methyltransferase [Verrucomicrobia bacterium]|nr:RsmB/NOP family class I SAM-dependent RNA methyltransferase [Verrucomicrobiota bacterium]